jgi:hypothetical protein
MLVMNGRGSTYEKFVFTAISETLLIRNWIPAAGHRNPNRQPIYAGIQTHLCPWVLTDTNCLLKRSSDRVK